MGFFIWFLISGWCLYSLLNWLTSSWETKEAQDKHKKALNRQREWLEVIEPKHRNAPTYPQDWIWRRNEVFLRAQGKCESCGMETGRLATSSKSGKSFIEPLLRGAHVHHIRKLSEGGDNSLSNLQLLCEPCHALKHPDKEIHGMINKGQSRKTHRKNQSCVRG